MKPTYRHGGTGRDPLGPRKALGSLGNVMFGLILVPLALYAGLRHGGWAWMILLIGVLLIATAAFVFYLDPVGGPRRRIRIRRRPRAARSAGGEVGGHDTEPACRRHGPQRR